MTSILSASNIIRPIRRPRIGTASSRRRIPEMARRLAVTAETWPIRGTFRIARGAKTQAHVIVAAIHDGDIVGQGECVPYARFGESVDSVLEQIQWLRTEMEKGLTREALQQRLPAGAARNALDCALIDLEAKASGRPAFELLGLAK